MKKFKTKSFSLLLIISLIALLIVQAFQTIELYDRESIEFQKKFTTTTETIALKHQKMEEIRKYLPVIDAKFSGRYKDILKEEFKNMMPSNESISIRDTVIRQNGEKKNFLIIQGNAYDSISGLQTQQRVLVRDIKELGDLFTNNQPLMHEDSIQLAIQLDERVMQQIVKKAQFVNDIMLEAFRDNIYRDPTQRIDPFLLDSIITNELKGKKLPSDFSFVITDENNAPIKFANTSKRYKTDLDTTKAHHTLLFPGDFLNSKLTLHITFNDQSNYVLSEIGGSLAINFILAFVIIISMIIMFRTILTQRKLHELKSDFISNMTHEFKTPISTISLACQALDDPEMSDSSSDESETFVKMIRDENKRLEILVERILQTATLERGELNLNTETIILNEVIENATNNARFQVKGRSGEIELKLPSNFVKINADRVHLRNVISNLLDNAIKYSNNSPKIIVELIREGNKHILSISDNGIGMKKEHLNKIFDNLYRIPTGDVHNVKGFGLGLGYVKSIVELHNWKISVTSQPNEGSTFKIEIH